MWSRKIEERQIIASNYIYPTIDGSTSTCLFHDWPNNIVMTLYQTFAKVWLAVRSHTYFKYGLIWHVMDLWREDKNCGLPQLWLTKRYPKYLAMNWTKHINIINAPPLSWPCYHQLIIKLYLPTCLKNCDSLTPKTPAESSFLVG